MNLTKRIQRQIFSRSLLIQGAWNFERMQSLGFAWSIDPWLKRVYPESSQKQSRARERHLEYFNTNPYMTGIILGVVARMEQDHSLGHAGCAEERIFQVKKSLASALAGIGDPFFWGAWRPLCVVISVIAAYGFRLKLLEYVIIQSSVYLILYNTPIQWIRWSGIRWGYDLGEKVSDQIKRLRFKRNLQRIRSLGLALSFLVAIIALRRIGGIGTGPIMLKGGVLSVCLAMKHSGWSAQKCLAALLLLGISAAYILA